MRLVISCFVFNNSKLYYIITLNADYQSPFFVIKPAVNMELNVARIFRIDLGASYRYIKGVELIGITDKDLSGTTVNLAFKFGDF